MGRILVFYDTLTGSTKAMAELVLEGVNEIPGHSVRLRSTQDCKASDVIWCDGIAVGTPTNLGGISWRMKKWWDDFAADNWDKVDGKICTTFSSQGAHGGGAEITCQAMGMVLMNFGFLFFGVTDYVSKIHSLHYGAVVTKEPRNETDKLACRRLGKRLAEWISYFCDGRSALHPLLTTKAQDTLSPQRKDSKLLVSNQDRTPVHVVVVKEVAHESQPKWLTMAKEMVQKTRQEPGCCSYNFIKKQDSETRFNIVEEWTSMQELESHFESPHFKRLVPQMDAISETVFIDLCHDAFGNVDNDAKATGNARLRPNIKINKVRNCLIFTKAADYVHDNIGASSAFLYTACKELGWNTIVSGDSSLLELPNAPEFDVIILCNNSGDLFDLEKEALTRHVEAGKGVLALHGAFATFLNDSDATGATTMAAKTPLIANILGAQFKNHPPIQTGTINVDTKLAARFSPDLVMLSESFEAEDEFYNFQSNPADVAGVRVLATVDETTYSGGEHDNKHPVVWYRHIGAASAPVFCCALGHQSFWYNNAPILKQGSHHVRTFLKAGLSFVGKVTATASTPE